MGSDMGRIIAVANIKGGVGKTTTVINVGAGLALMGARVLLVDTDVQGNIAVSLGVSPKHTLSEVLMDHRPVSDCLTPARRNLDLLAADHTLLNAQIALSHKPSWVHTLRRQLSPMKMHYDVIFIDAPGSLTPMTIGVLLAADEVIVPTTVEPLSLKGLSMLTRQMHQLTSRAILSKIVPTMYDVRLRQSGELLERLIQVYGPLVAKPIRINARLSEATAKGQTIYEYDARSRGALDYAELVNQLSMAWNLYPRISSSPSPFVFSPPPPSPDGFRLVPLSPSSSSPEPQSAPWGSRANPMLPHTHTCPHCGRLLKRTTLAGYRVVYCDHCRYRRQGVKERRQ